MTNLGPITPAKLVSSSKGKDMPPKPNKPNKPKQGELFGANPTPPATPKPAKPKPATPKVAKPAGPDLNATSYTVGVPQTPEASNTAAMPRAGIRTTGTLGLSPKQDLSNPLPASPNKPQPNPWTSAVKGTSPAAIAQTQAGVSKASNIPAKGTPERDALAQSMNQAKAAGGHSNQVQGTLANGKQHYGSFEHNGKKYYFGTPNQAAASAPSPAPQPSIQDKLKSLKNAPNKPTFFGDIGSSLKKGMGSVANFIANQGSAWKNRGEQKAVGGRNLAREGTSQVENAYALGYDPNKGILGNAMSGAKNWLQGTGKQLKGAFNEFQGRTGLHFEKEGDVIRFSKNGEVVELYEENETPKRRVDGSYDNSGF